MLLLMAIRLRRNLLRVSDRRRLSPALPASGCEAAAAIDEIDVQLIGSGDLTTNFGPPGKVEHPRLHPPTSRCRLHAGCTRASDSFRVSACRRNEGAMLSDLSL